MVNLPPPPIRWSDDDAELDQTLLWNCWEPARYLAGTQSERVVLMKPGTGNDPHEAFLRVWSDSGWAGDAKVRKSQSSLKIEVGGCPLYSASRKQKARAHSSGEAEYNAAASAASEAMLCRGVLLFTGLEAQTEELLLDGAAARGMCRRAGVGTIRHSVGETRSGHGWKVYIRRGPRRLGDKAIACPQTAAAEAMEWLSVGPK